jgi:hypothetical protein
MLVHEGVLVVQGSHAVRWAHDWLREYALIDLLIGMIDETGADKLAERIARLKTDGCHDHVVRSAAVGGAKWVLGDPGTWGPIEVYLSSLKTSLPGETSDALSMLMEGAERTVTLARLPADVMTEAILFATRLRATQWSRQIAALPQELFIGDAGTRLLRAVTDYELEASGNE